MCLPVALAVTGGLMGAAGSVVQGQAQARAYEAQAQVARQNARLAELQGQQELQKGAREEEKFRRQARRFQSTQRAQLAASGGQLGGSAASVLMDTASGIEEDAAAIRFNTLQSKWAKDMQALNFRNEASAARSSAGNARNAGLFGGFATLLNTGVTVAGMSGGVPTGAEVKGGKITMPQLRETDFGTAFNYMRKARGSKSFLLDDEQFDKKLWGL